MSETLFGYLAARFASSPENMATEALCYIFERSAVARRAFVRLLRRTGVRLSDDHRFVTQHSGSDGSIPDLVGLSANGELEIICEAKFAAGLTDNQPLAYLARLRAEASGVLVFIVPDRRIDRLWPILLARSERGNVACVDEQLIGTSYRCTTAGIHRLAILSWAALLSFVRHEVDVAGEAPIRGDIDQLIGLCDRMDSEAFVPLRSEDLTGEMGRHVLQLCEITDRVTEELVSSGEASISGLRASATRGSYGRYMKFVEMGAMVQFSSRAWMQWAPTPLWLVLFGPDWKFCEDIRLALAAFEVAIPPRLFRDDRGVYVPIVLPTNSELDGVVRAAVKQIKEVVNVLKSQGLLDRPVNAGEGLAPALQEGNDLPFGAMEPA